MDYVFEKCRGKKTVLMSPKEILQSLLPKHEITAKQLEGYLKNLALDGYLEALPSDNKGQMMYVVKLKTRGEAYEREKRDARQKRFRSLGWKIALTVLGAVLAFILGIILNSIFRSSDSDASVSISPPSAIIMEQVQGSPTPAGSLDEPRSIIVVGEW